MLKNSLLSLITIISLISSNSIICKEEQKYDTSFARKISLLAGLCIGLGGIRTMIESIATAESAYYNYMHNIKSSESCVALGYGVIGILETLAGALLIEWGVTNPKYIAPKKADLENNKVTTA